MADIFLSYDTRDGALAQRLGDALTALGHRAHLYEDEVRPGEPFVEWMRERLSAGELFACIYTSKYLTSPYTQFEFDTALNETLTAPGFLLLFRFEDCAVTRGARQFPRCDLFGVADAAEFRARIASYLAADAGGAAAHTDPPPVSEKRPNSVRIGIVEGLAAVAALATVWGTLQSDLPVAARWSAFAAISMLLLFGVHFYAVLHGATEPSGSRGRREFVGLRASLVKGGAFEVVYAGFLTRALDTLDRLLGDPAAGAGATKPTLAQCWSAAAYDRCLLLALLYPWVTMCAVWTISGRSGDAERAFGFGESSLGQRLFEFAAFMPAVYGYSIIAFGMSRDRWVGWFIVGPLTVAVTVLGALAGVGAGSVVEVLLLFIASPVAIALAGMGVGSVVAALAFAASGAGALPGPIVLGVASIVAVGFVFDGLKTRKRLGSGLLGFTVLALAASFAAARHLSHNIGWDGSGPLLVYCGLLTVINAPFDWFAIGLTRYLLRFGLALGGPWPIMLAVIDALSAAMSVALLRFACIEAVQTFGDIAAHFGGGEEARIIHLGEIFDSLGTDAAAPDNLWIWFMLFSTAIPSVVNLLIACSAALRALPFVNRWLLAELLEGEAMSEPAKIRVALVLAGQWALGALATFWLVYWLFIVAGPLVGPAYAQWLLDLSQSVARCNWPARAIIALWGGGWQGCR